MKRKPAPDFEIPGTVAWLEDPLEPGLFSARDATLGVGRIVANVPLPWFRILRPQPSGLVRCIVPTPPTFSGRVTVEVDLPVPALLDALTRGVMIRGKVVAPLCWHRCPAGFVLAHPQFSTYEQLSPPTPGPRWPAGVFTKPWGEARAAVLAEFETAYWRNIFVRAKNFTHAAAMGHRTVHEIKIIFRRFGFMRDFRRR